jgi:hypothetical protein
MMAAKWIRVGGQATWITLGLIGFVVMCAPAVCSNASESQKQSAVCDLPYLFTMITGHRICLHHIYLVCLTAFLGRHHLGEDVGEAPNFNLAVHDVQGDFYVFLGLYSRISSKATPFHLENVKPYATECR